MALTHSKKSGMKFAEYRLFFFFFRYKIHIITPITKFHFLHREVITFTDVASLTVMKLNGIFHDSPGIMKQHTKFLPTQIKKVDSFIISLQGYPEFAFRLSSSQRFGCQTHTNTGSLGLSSVLGHFLFITALFELNLKFFVSNFYQNFS